MRSAIVLIWLSLSWTLLCFLFYRDRELILQASLPVWIAAGVAWTVYRTMGAAVLSRLRRGGAKPRGRKKAAPRPAPRAGGARRTARKSAAKPGKRSS